MNETPPTPPETHDDAPSTEFADALAHHEAAGGAPAAAAQRAAVEVRAGARVKAKVISIGEEHVLVDFGGRSEGVVETRHLRSEDGTLKAAVGDTLDLFVIEAGDQVVLAPKMRTAAHAALQTLREAQAAGAPVSGRVTGLNAGGLTVDLGGVRGFCPASQIEAGYCADASAYVGKTLDFLVTKIEENRRSAVVSRRQLLRREEDARARELLATLKPGDEREGRVARLEAFGAFVDLGGVDGMVHVSEIRHERVGHPKQALKEGDTVRVKVLRIEAGKEGKPRIALSIKAATPDPWNGIEMRYVPGGRVRGTVARIADFGAFVTIEPGVDGLVHVSEISHQRIAHPRDALSPGQEVEAMVKSVDVEKRRISLSIRQTLPLPEGVAEEGRERGAGPGGGRRREGGERFERGERGGRGGRGGERGGRGGERGGRDRRRGRDLEHEHDEGPSHVVGSSTTRSDEPTTMAIALRKAMEEARRKQEHGGA
uniref:S1 RNA-binding domain-containing protein n=1 Tax=Eiseniibacteriota bacterium TaxID=2212470 RepID=A0A832MJY8_UNCEI